MKGLTFRTATTLFTFIVGLGVAMAWGFQSRSALVPPVAGTGHPGNAPALEMVFVIDTTGSMGGLIEGAKQRVWGIVNEVMQSSTHPAVRIGPHAYKDHG